MLLSVSVFRMILVYMSRYNVQSAEPSIGQMVENAMYAKLQPLLFSPIANED